MSERKHDGANGYPSYEGNWRVVIESYPSGSQYSNNLLLLTINDNRQCTEYSVQCTFLQLSHVILQL